MKQNSLFSMNSSQFPTNFGIFSACQKADKQNMSSSTTLKNTNTIIPYSIIEFASNKMNNSIEMKNWSREKRMNQFIAVRWYRFWFGCGGWTPKVWQNFWMNRNNLMELPVILIVNDKLIRNRPSQDTFKKGKFYQVSMDK